MKDGDRNTFFVKLTKACPALPYMALGLWLSWASVAYSSTAWLSNTETDGANISVMFIFSTSVFGLGSVLAALSIDHLRKVFQRQLWLLCGGALSSLGCLIIIVIGPYYLHDMIPETVVMAMFYLACGMCGLGMVPVGLKCGEMYSGLPPRRVVLYVALSYFLLATSYFIVVGMPNWQPVAGGPSLAGMTVFILMPFVAALCASLIFFVKSEKNDDAFPGERHNLPRAFWKLLAVVVVFSVIVSAVRAIVVEVSPVDATLSNAKLVMLFIMVMAAAFASAAIGFDADRFNFGKVYSVIMAAAVAVIAFIPIFDVLHVLLNQIVEFVFHIFEFVLWCILAFIVHQKRVSPFVVFGLGYGLFMLGSGLGWALGAHGLVALASSDSAFVLYLVLAFAVLGCAFVLFSEKEFENLFEPTEQSEPTLDVLFREEVVKDSSEVELEPGQLKKGKFSLVVEEIAEQSALSNRESEVFRCLAMGYDSTAIAKKLQVSWNTVRTHTRNVYAKLDVHSRQEIIELVDEASKVH